MLKLTMENVIRNSTYMETTISFLKNELNILRKAYTDKRIRELLIENSELSQQVEYVKQRLTQLETAHGIRQILIPGAKSISTTNVTEEIKEPKPQKPANVSEEAKAAKKEKKKAQPAKKPEAEQSELPVDVGRLDLRVGQIMQVEKHPDADSLYVSKIKCGDPSLRTVVSGLVKFVPLEDLQNRKVVVLCNLKPVKMRGITSEAMVMCASTPDAVEVLSPPSTAEPGDLIECDGYKRQPDAQMNPKKKIFETVAPDLKTNDSLQATYKDNLLNVPGKGPITTKSLKNVNIK